MTHHINGYEWTKNRCGVITLHCKTANPHNKGGFGVLTLRNLSTMLWESWEFVGPSIDDAKGHHHLPHNFNTLEEAQAFLTERFLVRLLYYHLSRVLEASTDLGDFSNFSPERKQLWDKVKTAARQELLGLL